MLVSEPYLQQERSSRIPDHNDDQSDTPVMGNTHDLGRQERMESGECGISEPMQHLRHSRFCADVPTRGNLKPVV